jgi:hypothetical protein
VSKCEKDNETKTERESDKFEERERGGERDLIIKITGNAVMPN